jgi:hypothetical protein
MEWIRQKEKSHGARKRAVAGRNNDEVKKVDSREVSRE